MASQQPCFTQYSLEECRFARANWSDNHDQLGWPNSEVDVFENGVFTALRGK